MPDGVLMIDGLPLGTTDNGDGTRALTVASSGGTGGGPLAAQLPATLGQKAMAASLAVVLASDQTSIPTKDAGPAQTVTRTYTASADMTTAAAISPAPAAAMKQVATDILVSSDTAMSFSIQEETSATVFAKVFIPANGTVPITLRGYLKTAVAVKKFMGKASVAGNVAVTCITFDEA